MKKYLVLAVLTALAIGISLYNPPVSVQAQGQSDQARQLKTLCHFDNSIDDFGHVLLLPCKSLAEHIRHGDRVCVNLDPGSPCTVATPIVSCNC